jgi:DNA-binding NarL/FixJ family response regulator
MIHIWASLTTLSGRLEFSLRSFLLRWFNRTARHSCLYMVALDEDMSAWLHELSASENRPAYELAEQMLTYALIQRQRADENLRIWKDLSPREREVAALVTLGYTNREMAARLVVSPETIKTHTQRIMSKFQVKCKYDLRIALAEWDFREWDIDEPTRPD